MLGIRASPTGRYLLILLRGAPSEIWAVRPLLSFPCLMILIQPAKVSAIGLPLRQSCFHLQKAYFSCPIAQTMGNAAV